MDEFYIDVELGQEMTRIQADEVPPEQWNKPFCPEFVIEFYKGKGFITMTLQLEKGRWYDRDTRVPGNDPYLPYIETTTGYLSNRYQSPLSEPAICKIGQAIARHMIVHLTTYMGLFIPVFREPTLN